MADRGTAQFVGPLAPPGHFIIGGIAVPQRVADGDQRPPEGVGRHGGAEMRDGGTVTELEDGGAEPVRALGSGLDQVDLGQRRAQGFLAQNIGSGLHRHDGQAGVQTGWRADVHQIRLDLGETSRGIRKHAWDAVLGGKRRRSGVIDVNNRDQFGPVGVGAEAADMLAGDTAGSNDGCTNFTHD